MPDQLALTTADILRRTNNFSPPIGIILGTGLGHLVEEIEIRYSIPYQEIPDFPVSTVPGHPGSLIFGSIGKKNVVAMQGRFHFYEGYSMKEIAFPIRVMKELGVSTLIVSNASGGMNPHFEVGDLMIITDHINFFPDNPLIGKNDDRLGPRFVDMGETYNKDYIKLAKEIAIQNNILIKEGVYVGLTGPCFETPAEYRFLHRMGADSVGMSTVPEVITAKHAGMKVFGISIITDLGVEGRTQEISHEEVMRVAKEKEPLLSLLVKELVQRIETDTPEAFH